MLPIAVWWGTPYAVLVAVASMLTFNFFFLPPVYTFNLADGRNAPSETLILRPSPDMFAA